MDDVANGGTQMNEKKHKPKGRSRDRVTKEREGEAPHHVDLGVRASRLASGSQLPSVTCRRGDVCDVKKRGFCQIADSWWKHSPA